MTMQSNVMMIAQKVMAILRTPWPLMGAWIIGGILTIIVPISVWKKERNEYYTYRGQYVEYEINQRNYEEAQNGNNNNNNNNQRRYWTCKWNQFQCRKNLYKYHWFQENNNGQMMRLPDWYASLGGTLNQGNDDRREREEMGENGSADTASGAVKFVFVFMMVLFCLLLVYGVLVMCLQHRRQQQQHLNNDSNINASSRGGNMSHLVIATALFGLSAFMQMLLLPQGVIRQMDMEQSIYGWYGQLPVLMVYSDWAYFWFCFIFCALVGLWSIVVYLVEHGCFVTRRRQPVHQQERSPSIASKEFMVVDADEPLDSNYKPMPTMA